MKKRWLRLMLKTMAAAILLLLLGIGLLLTPPAGHFLFKQARSRLRNSSAIDIQAAKFRYNLFTGEIVLQGLTVRSASEPDLPPIFQADQISIRPQILRLLRGSWDFDELQIAAPRIHYFMGQDGRDNLPKSGSGSKSPANFLINHAEAENGFFKFEDLQKKFNITLPQWQLFLDGNPATRDHRIRFSTQQPASLQFQAQTIPFEQIAFSGILQQDTLHADSVYLKTADSELSLTGDIRSFSEPQIDLKLSPDLDIGEATRILKTGNRFEGSLAGKIHLKGASNSLEIDAQLRGTNVSALSFRKANFDLQSHAKWTPSHLRIQDAKIKFPDSYASGSADLFTDPGLGANSIEAELSNLSLSPIWKLIRPPFDLASRATGRISLNWKGALVPLKLSGRARLNLTASAKTPGPYVLPASGKLDAQLSPGRMLINLEALTVLGADVQGQATLHSFKEINGQLHGESEDIGTLISNLSLFLGGSDSPTGTMKLKGPIQFDTHTEGNLSSPIVTVTSRIPELQAGILKNLSASTQGKLENSRITYQGTIVLPESASIHAKGSLDIGGHDTILNLDALGDSIPATSIAKIFESDLPLSGDLNARLHLEGIPGQLTGDASIEGAGLSMFREPMGNLNLRVHLEGNEIKSTQFELLKDPLNPVSDRADAQFTYSLDSDRFHFEANGKGIRLKHLDSLSGMPIQATWDLAASGTGTTEQPSIDIKIDSSDVRIREQSIGSVSLVATLRGEDVKLQSSAPKLQVNALADVAAVAPYNFSSELHIANTDLAQLDFKALNGQLLTGAFEADITGSGNLSEFAQSRFSATLKNLKLQAGKLETHIQGTMHLEYKNNALEIPEATIVSGNSKLMVSGNLALDPQALPGLLNLKGQLDLAQVSGLAFLPQGCNAAGIVDVDLAVGGTVQKPDISGAVTMNGGLLHLPGILTPLTEIAIRANVSSGSVTLQRADASWDQGKISLRGEFPFGLLPKNIPLPIPRKDGPAVFVLDASNIQPEASGKLSQGMSGLISLHAEGEAPSMDLHALEARIDIRDLRFQASEIHVEQKQTSTILLHNGIATISALSFSGADTSIEASGSIGLSPGSPLSVKLTGDLNAGLLTFMSRDLKATGRLKVKLAVDGDFRAPRLSGSAEMNGGKLSLRTPRVVADSLTMRLELDPEKITVREFKGTLNGGPLNVTGAIAYHNGILNGIDLTATMQDFFFDFPQGLKSSSSGTLTIKSSEDTIVVSGNMRIQDSSYRESFDVTGQLMSYLKEQQVIIADREPDPILSRIRLNISLRTETPLVVQNNIAKVGGNINVRLVGPFEEPSMVGRISLEEGGEIVVNRQTYYINRGTIALVNQTRIEPEIDLQAQAKIGSYEITLQMTGSLDRLTTNLSSEPPLSQADITALMLTGKTTSESQGSGMQAARTQALALVAGQASEELTDEARKALRLSTLRIDPGLIASESDPGARLTIGQNITKKLTLVYSMNLTNGGDQIWAAEYEVARRFTTQATQQQDNTYRFDLNHVLLFGRSTENRRNRTPSKTFEIGEIRFNGGEPVSDKTLQDKFKIKTGQKYDFPKIQLGLDRLHDFYARQNYLEANVRLHRDTLEKTVDLTLNIDPGPVVDFSFEGTSLTEADRKAVRDAWTNGVFDLERIEDAVQAIRMPLLAAGFLQSEISYSINTEDNHKNIHFQIKPGIRYTNVPIVFSGASAIPALRLSAALEQANMQLEVYANPKGVADYVSRIYRENGYLQASIGIPTPQLDPQTRSGKTVIQIQEGPLFTIGELEFNGNHAFNYDELWSVIPTSSGSSYDPNTLQDAIRDLQDLYHGKGYNDVSVTFRVVLDAPASKADLTFYIIERRQSIIRDITIEGNTGTTPDFIRRQLAFSSGNPLDFTKINETRKRLYGTSVYSSVDFQTEEMPNAVPDPKIKEVRVRIRVREVQPYRVQYGFFYDTERGPGGLVEAENRNLLGRAVNVGLRFRYDSDLKEARVYFYQPFITKIHLKTDASAFALSETRPGFSADRVGFSIFRESKLAREFRLDYGYRYDHVRWDGIPDDPTIFQSSVPVARLITTLSRDTRDSVLDATRGEFSSHSLEFGPRFVGSEIGFIRYYGQYFRYVPLDKFILKPPKEKEKKATPPKLLYAGALRLGLTTAFGHQSVISPERFFAGGGTTMRGFEQDMLGPTVTLEDGTVRPYGGEALFLFNNEIRFPVIGILHGVGFVDIGNVYPRVSDFDFNVRKTAGAGLRLKIKSIPLRFDYGVKLDRRPGESKGAFFFSIGQAF